MRKGGIASALLVVSLIAADGHAQDEEDVNLGEVRTIARLVATSGMAGDLAYPVCRGDEHLRDTPFANLTPQLVSMAARDDRPMILDTGSLLTPGAVARYAAAQQPDALAELISSLGYRALIFGPNELAASREPMLQAFRALRERGIPGIASNLFCIPGGGAEEVCEVLVDGSDGPSIHIVDDMRVAVVSVMPGDAIAALAPDLSEGLRATTPQIGMTSAVRRARAAGAEIVIAVLDHGANEEDAAGKAIELVTQLPEDARPNILFAPGAGEQLVFARPPTIQPAIVAAPPGGALSVRIRENFVGQYYDVLARPIPPSTRVAPQFTRWSVDIGRRLCERWGDELPGGRLSEPITGRGLLELSAGIIRQRAEAELAVVDEGLLSRQWRAPDDGSLSGVDVYFALQYDEQIVVADVPALWLEKVAKALEADGYLIIPGLEYDPVKKTTRVNGRPLEMRGTYRVATLHFLAAGGANQALLPLTQEAEWEPMESASVRRTVLEFLQEERDEDPREALVDPADRLEWTFRVDIDARLAGTTVTNPTDEEGEPLYTATQLGRANSLTFGFTSQLRADAVSREWGWENEGVARYRTTQTNIDPFAEGDDILSLRSTIAYRRWRSEIDRFYVPEPYVEGYLESEFTQPSTRDYHHLFARPTAGLRFKLTPHLRFQLGGGLTTQLLDDNREVLPGLSAQLVLMSWVVALDALNKRKLMTEFTFDYFLTTQSQELRGRWDTTLDIAAPFQMVFGFQLFGRKEPNRELGISFDVTAGLRIAWLGRVGP